MQTLTIAFDLDGTLVETAPDLIRATNHVMTLTGLPAVEGPDIRPYISFGARAMIEAAVKMHGSKRDSAEVDRLYAEFLTHYADNIAVESHAFPGLEAALDRLAARGARFAVCTNKSEVLSRQLLTALGLINRFKAIAGRDTFAVYKPNPAHLTGVIERAGGDPTRAIMVGDSETDIATARAADIPVIGVPFGYTATPMRDLGPDIVMEHYDQLDAAVEQLSTPKER